MNMQEMLTLDLPARYRLRIQGRVNADWSDWLSEVSMHFDFLNGKIVTVINGMVRDQAALFGLLSFIRDLGVPLISVEAIV